MRCSFLGGAGAKRKEPKDRIERKGDPAIVVLSDAKDLIRPNGEHLLHFALDNVPAGPACWRRRVRWGRNRRLAEALRQRAGRAARTTWAGYELARPRIGRRLGFRDFHNLCASARQIHL